MCAVALGLFLAVLPAARAEEPGRLMYYSLGVAQGLANDSVYCILQDSLGFMWFGTFGGLSRYDGESFTTYRPSEGPGSLHASVVFALAEDGLGQLWVGTDGGGLARYERDLDSFSVLRADPADPAGLSSDRVLALGRDSSGRLWVGTGDGVLNILNPATASFAHLLPPEKKGGGRDPIRCIAPDLEGGVWVGTEGSGLLHIDGQGAIKAFVHDPARPASLAFDVVRSLLVDSAGRLWIGLGNGGVERLEGEGFAHSLPAQGQAGLGEAVRALAEDPEGGIWVGWADSGIGTLDPASMSLHAPGPDEAAMVRTLYRDRGGLVWAGMKGGGARTYNVASGHFRRYTSLASGQAIRQVRGMAELPDGRILAGTDGQGLLVLGRQGGPALPLPGMPRDREALKVYAVLVGREGSIWAGTDGAGLIRLLPDGRVVRYQKQAGVPASISGNVVWSLLEEADGRVWVGTEGAGLDLLDPETGRFEHFRHDARDRGSLHGSSIRSIYRDSRRRLWIGTWDGGLSRLDPGSRTFANYLPDGATGSSLADASVNCVLEDRLGNIWVGTGGSGLALLNPDTGTFLRYDVASGLVGSTVYGLLEDQGGLIWVATATGLSSLDRGTETFFSYGAEDGLASGEISQNACLAARDGSIWVGGPEGITSFLPREVVRERPKPPVAITSVVGSDGSVPKRSPDGSRIVLPYENAGLGFRIAVLDYSAPARNRYALKLEGRQAAWTELEYSNSGTLAHLPPGEYVLRAKGANGNGIWNEEGATLGILVEPPIWGTLWFRLAAGAFLLLLTSLAIMLRTRTLRARNLLLVNFARHVEDAREEERTNAAREVHDEIGQHLTVLNLQSWWLKNHPDAGLADRFERLSVMQNSISAALAAVKSVATRLRPIALGALSFGETTAWYAKDFEHRTGIACKARIGEGIPPLTDAEATALFRVLQEALANVARHSGAGEVTISLTSDAAWVTLDIEDNGVGIEAAKAQAPDAFGIIGMRERCAAFGGSLELGTAPGGGTRVSARVPAKGGDRPC